MHALTILIFSGLFFTAFWSVLSYSGTVQFEFYRLSRLIRHPCQKLLGHRPPPAMTRKEFVRQFNEGSRAGYRLTTMGTLTEDEADTRFGIMSQVYTTVSQQRKALQDNIDSSSDRLTRKINQLTNLCQSLDSKVANNQQVLVIRGVRLEEDHMAIQRLAQSIRDDVLYNQQTLIDIRSSVRKILRQVSCASVNDFNEHDNGGGDRHGDGAAGHQDEPVDRTNREAVAAAEGAIPKTGGATAHTGGATAHTGGGGHSDSDIGNIGEVDSFVNPAAADCVMRLLERDAKPKKELQWYTPIDTDQLSAAPPPIIKKEPGCFGNLNRTAGILKSQGRILKK